MSISENAALAVEIENKLVKALPIRLGVNKRNELVRLVYEICLARGLTAAQVFEKIKTAELVEEGKNGLFHRVKGALVEERYPSFLRGGDTRIMPLKIGAGREECRDWQRELSPKAIFVEKEVEGYEWTEKFLGNFPEADVIKVKKLTEALAFFRERDPVARYNGRRDNVFLVRNRAAFIKICPCSNNCKRCGYWILNIGFGCPMDCSYCYLQLYNRVPGMVLPANVEEYYPHIERFNNKVSGLTRIGTGEFTDSLAFDRYTGYSGLLAPFFRKTNKLVLELKTKTTEIDSLLRREAHDHVVVSWSMNTRRIAAGHEKGGAGISERLEAASRAAAGGYRIGFHFDPIVFYEGWEDEYSKIVEEIFSRGEINEKTAWISLGTLRYTPGLKQLAENRFSDNGIFYQGDFLEDVDGKLRYPRRLRIEMYNKMIKWIRRLNERPWIYLCMEPESVWKKTELGKEDYEFGRRAW